MFHLLMAKLNFNIYQIHQISKNYNMVSNYQILFLNFNKQIIMKNKIETIVLTTHHMIKKINNLYYYLTNKTMFSQKF